jgi:hypothetical protein
MARLSDEQIKHGMLHPDADVRFACLHYFADCHSRDDSVMTVVIEALERFGRTEAFTYTHPIAGLAQTEGTVRWVIEELKNQPRRTEEQTSYLDSLSGILCRAEPRLILPFESEILTAQGFDPGAAEPLSRRLKLLSWDGDGLWRELEAICEEGKDKDFAGDLRYDEAEHLVEALGRDGDRHADRMMGLLAIKIDTYENNPLTWMEPLMVRLAGELRYQPAIPLVVAKLHDDTEVMNEECQTALVKIGDDGVVQALRDAYVTAEWPFRLYAQGALGHIHTDLAVQTCIELLDNEQDLDLKNWLAQSLVQRFSYEGNERARKVLLSDPDLYHLKRALLTACKLMGQDFPELEQWRKDIEEETLRKPFLYGRTSESSWSQTPSATSAAAPAFRQAPYLKPEKKVGRNDPCPCGSGKKFKKCCLNKGSLL